MCSCSKGIATNLLNCMLCELLKQCRGKLVHNRFRLNGITKLLSARATMRFKCEHKSEEIFVWRQCEMSALKGMRSQLIIRSAMGAFNSFWLHKSNNKVTCQMTRRPANKWTTLADKYKAEECYEYCVFIN